ncbi:MAG: FG-GAP repeat protein [Microthrixaceae bacterium]
MRRAFEGITIAFTAAGRGRLRRTRSTVSRGRPAAWAIAAWLAATMVIPMPAMAHSQTEGDGAGTTRHGTAAEDLVKLIPSDGTALGHFGNDVAVSGDTAVVGAPNMHHSAFMGTGAAYVFTRVGESWTEQAKLTPSDGVRGDRFGWSVAISGDTIVVGAMWHDVGAHVDQGAAYVFTRTAGTWTEQAKLRATDGLPLAEFGISVAVSDDDVLVGAMTLADEVGAPPQGSAYLFSRVDEHWTQQAKLTPPDGVFGSGFGFRVALDGDTAVVGASRDNGGLGAAHVFNRTDGHWTAQAELTAPNGVAGDAFGFWVGLDDDTIVVGAPAHNGQGAAYVFTRSGGQWTPQATLTASDGTDKAANPPHGDYFGRSVAVSGDTIVVGAEFDKVSADNAGQGSAYVFERTGTTWSETTHLSAADADLFGVSVGVSGDTAVVGASFSEVGDAQGAAYVWRDRTPRDASVERGDLG